MNLTVMVLLLLGLVISAVLCVVMQNLLKASIALAITSAILAVIMFLLGAELAAVFELSVCAGLITVVFISAISMTRIRTKEEITAEEKKRHKRFIWLPVLMVVLLAAALFLLWPRLNTLIPQDAVNANLVSAQDAIWEERQQDMLGQIIIVLAGVFGVLIFFKERDKE
jgi:NADH:ubiquinone oxidoreductase subunit 6 (chain J)